MNWTKEQPVEPGFYWVKFSTGGLMREVVAEIQKSGAVWIAGVNDDDWGKWSMYISSYWPEKLEPPKD